METKEVGFTDKMALAMTLVESVNGLMVTNAQEHAAVGAQVAIIRDYEKELESEYKALPVIIEAKRLQGVKGEMAALLEKTRKDAKARQMAWEDEEERKRMALEAKLAAEAKKQADNEALERARLAQDEGNHEEAAQVLAEAISTPAPVVVIPKTAPKAVGRRMVPKFRIVNASLIPRQYLMPNEVAIGGVIRSLRAEANIPGVQFYEEAA